MGLTLHKEQTVVSDHLHLPAFQACCLKAQRHVPIGIAASRQAPMALSSLSDRRAEASAAWLRSSGAVSTSGRTAVFEQPLWHQQLWGRRRHQSWQPRPNRRRESPSLQSSTLEEAPPLSEPTAEHADQLQVRCFHPPSRSPPSPHPSPISHTCIIQTRPFRLYEAVRRCHLTRNSWGRSSRRNSTCDCRATLRRGMRLPITTQPAAAPSVAEGKTALASR